MAPTGVGLVRRLRNYLAAGIVTLLPIVATWYALRWLFGLMEALIRDFLPVATRQVLPTGSGVVAGIVVLLLTGVVVTHLGGKRMLLWAEGILNRVPVIKSLYGFARSVTDALFGTSSQAFQKPALIEYPTDQTYTLAFITGRIGTAYSVFVPTTPNPTSGWYLVVPAHRVVPLETVTVEGAMKLIISGGAFGLDLDSQREVERAVAWLNKGGKVPFERSGTD